MTKKIAYGMLVLSLACLPMGCGKSAAEKAAEENRKTVNDAMDKSAEMQKDAMDKSAEMQKDMTNKMNEQMKALPKDVPPTPALPK